MTDSRRSNFLTEIIEADLAQGKNGGKVVTRFPPEPNGFLHIGHSKSILLNFGLAKQFGGQANLRFDDTNPTTEDTEYVDSIQEDARWLGADWGKNLFFASDYFERMYQCALRLIREGKAYVDSQSVDAIREQRGNFDRPGTTSPHRDRGVEENLALFTQMREGKFPDGACVLRAKIDMAHPNVLMRDPLLYRIRHAHHHRTGDAWCIYPMYDYAHPLEDAFEGVTHSICTLEFESNRPLYDWVLDNLGPWNPRPRQYEFARLALGYTVMSKRKLLQLVTEKRVNGWDDPRMPTIAGMRRRGVPPEALRDFAEMIGVAKNNSLVDIGKFEFAIRNDLESRAPRGMGVLHPLRVTLTNWKQDDEELELEWWPGEPGRGGSRKVPFGAQLLIEREDFTEEPPRDWKRLAPGREVRLLGAYVIKCDEVIKGPGGEVLELRCSYDPSSRGGKPADNRKVPGALHWVHATRALPAEVRLYDRLFKVELPDAEGDFLQHLNPDSLQLAAHARVEPAVAALPAASRVQFLRLGYFYSDPVDHRAGKPVFNRILGLKDTWTKAAVEAPEEKKPEKASHEPRDAGPARKSRAEARAELRARTPVLAERFTRYQQTLGLSAEEAELLTANVALGDYFEGALATHAQVRGVFKWLANELLGLVDEEALASLPLQAGDFGRLVALVDEGKLTASAGKSVLGKLVQQGGDPAALVRELGLERTDSSESVADAVRRAFQKNAPEVARYRAGEKKLLGVLIGAVMRETQGVADPAAVRKAVMEMLAQAS